MIFLLGMEREREEREREGGRKQQEGVNQELLVKNTGRGGVEIGAGILKLK